MPIHANKTTMLKLMTVLTLALATAFPATATADVVDTIEKSYDFDSDGRIKLSNINGDVTIQACDCNRVTVKAEIIASTQAIRDRISVDISDSSSLLKIETKYKESDNGWNSGRSEVIYELEVPRSVNLEGIALVNGDLNIEGVSGALDADLVNGNLNSDGLSSTTRVNMVNGNISLKFKDLSAANSIRLNSVNGKIAVYLPANPDVKVDAETVSGHISNEFDLKVIKHRYVGSEMSGKLGTGRVKIHMDNVNGKIALNAL